MLGRSPCSSGRICCRPSVLIGPTQYRGYLQLSNLYAFASLWDCIAKIRGIDEGEKTDKRPGV